MWQIIAVTWLQENDLGCEFDDYKIVRFQDIAAITTRTDYQSVDKLDVIDKVDALFSYQNVLERAGIGRTIIPVRFGTMVKTKREIISLLEKNFRRFKSLLRYAKGKKEYDLMGIWREKIGNLKSNIFEDFVSRGFEVKPHEPGNRAICFHFSVLMSKKEQKNFAIIKEDLYKRLGNKIDVRVSEPLPPFNFFTVDINESIKELRGQNLNTLKKG